jgi:sRNA-binding regulator protein Hfq
MGFRFLQRGPVQQRQERGVGFALLSPSKQKPAPRLVSLFPRGGSFRMSIHAVGPPFGNPGGHDLAPPQDRGAQRRALQLHARKGAPVPSPFRFPAQSAIDEGTYRQAELFYLQKQIQSQTPMVIVMEDGEQLEGCIEWYDRNCLKVRGRAKTLIYKSAIKYMYKVGEQGQ